MSVEDNPGVGLPAVIDLIRKTALGSKAIVDAEDHRLGDLVCKHSQVVLVRGA